MDVQQRAVVPVDVTRLSFLEMTETQPLPARVSRRRRSRPWGGADDVLLVDADAQSFVDVTKSMLHIRDRVWCMRPLSNDDEDDEDDGDDGDDGEEEYEMRSG